ncbi:flagellin [Rhizobium sp. VS19-DR104.2]|uniref:flagellin N-terminal helical domain-containing protein n=1 Tax=unclassified Rhizobium TaxID=2613769 RepID=UPI001C5B922F|nr:MULTISPECIES: flagellin [unclassified Rhizobium]MBZ5763071.1 flagellin [Rhizobium sp. VS19-DR96]MBZ5768947.1 flagellin [Rhizobium sp. VS19-DR129.2]MBZ5776565.1 flagellin [Rhizobium sp. VS19-DRK62.2]MBZ5787696.1 flagellin [Rhizobium sp. VS19-DR121]MBZ5805069.1 flagellin [Rhizobium sp. VS19-DR181]
MTSIKTNNAAMSALMTLRNVNSSLTQTQSAVSSGLRISKASDNATYWSIATTMKSDVGALGAVSDALGLGAAKVDTAYTAMDSAISIVSQIKDKLVTAKEGSVDKSKIQGELTQLQAQLKSVATSASFNGENWVVAASGGSASVVSSFIRNASGGVSVTTSAFAFNAGSHGNVLFGSDGAGGADMSTGILGSAESIGSSSFSVYSLDISGMTGGGIDSAMNMVESAMSSMTSAAAQLGSLSSRIDLQTTFASSLSDSITSGVGKLVDANMEQESSKLSALQTQQQLAVQSLSIANSSAQSILSLFK